MEKQTNLTIISVAILAIVAVAVLLKSDGSSPKNTANVGDAAIYGGELLADHTAYDFGRVPINGGLVDHEFVLNNNSSAPVKIGRTETSCMCTTAFVKLKSGGKEVGPFGMPGHGGFGLLTNANLTVNPGDSLIVRAVFDPAAHGPAGVGMIERQISLETSGSAPIILDFKATVTP